MALAPWTATRKRAFLDDQFRLQHLHFTRHFPRADFWLVLSARTPSAPRPVGRLYLDRAGTEWRIVDIGLSAAARGSGIGGALIAWVQASAAAARADGVSLHVAANNPRARALYGRLGFREAGPAEDWHQPMSWRPGPS